MPKGIAWRHSEIEFIKENVEQMTVAEMAESLPGRSKKSITRMIEKLREKGELGYKYKGAEKTRRGPKPGSGNDDSPFGSYDWS